MLPMTGGQLYLGDYPASVRSTYAELVRNNGGEPQQWRDMHWQFLALGDPDAALAKFRASGGSYTSEEGESKAHTFHWLRNLAALGQVVAYEAGLGAPRCMIVEAAEGYVIVRAVPRRDHPLVIQLLTDRTGLLGLALQQLSRSGQQLEAA
jgi:hypothetical protein